LPFIVKKKTVGLRKIFSFGKNSKKSEEFFRYFQQNTLQTP